MWIVISLQLLTLVLLIWVTYLNCASMFKREPGSQGAYGRKPTGRPGARKPRSPRTSATSQMPLPGSGDGEQP